MTFSDLKYYCRILNEMKEKRKYCKGKIFDIPYTKGMLFPYKIQLIIQSISYSIKSYFQRARNGYSHGDVWDIDQWFSKTISNMLQDFIENSCGYPGYGDADTPEKWKEILRYMRFCFLESQEDTCSQKNELDIPNTNFEITKDGNLKFNSDNPEFQAWSKREEELALYRKKMLEEGLNLFKKYYYDLWD